MSEYVYVFFKNRIRKIRTLDLCFRLYKNDLALEQLRSLKG